MMMKNVFMTCLYFYILSSLFSSSCARLTQYFNVLVMFIKSVSHTQVRNDWNVSPIRYNRLMPSSISFKYYWEIIIGSAVRCKKKIFFLIDSLQCMWRERRWNFSNSANFCVLSQNLIQHLQFHSTLKRVADRSVESKAVLRNR